VIGEAANGREAVALVCEQRPDVAIFDIGMTLLNGIEATRQVMRRLPLMRVLILSMHAERSYVDAALRAGAKGYLLKDSMDSDLVRAVEYLSHGRPFFSPEVAALMLDGYGSHDRPAGDPFDTLSEREREIVQLIAEARTSKEIASLLSISVGTVETHRARIFAKLDIHSTAALVLYAVRKGVVS
jgi:DNA-binding NarL/FixJ family response regulator